MIDARVRMHFFSRVVGIGSSRQCLPSEFIIKLVISSSVAAAKQDKLKEEPAGLGKCGEVSVQLGIEVLRLVTLSEKNVANLSGSVSTGSEG